MQTADTNTVRQTEPATTGTHRRRRSRMSYRCQAKIRRYQYLLAGISILFLILYTLTWTHFVSKSGERERAIRELKKLQIAHEAATTEVEQIRSERDILVQGRIPNLLPLKFDEAIPIDNDFIRNVIFTLVKNGTESIYEYRVVLNNDSLSVIRPKVEISLFNDIGIQIGNAKIQSSDATSDINRNTLEPGEVRSFSAAIDMIRQGEPAYFMMLASEPSDAAPETLQEHLGNVISP